MSKQQFSLQEEQYFTLLGKVGLVVHLSQMIEYNIANILALDELCENFYKSKNVLVEIDASKDSTMISKEIEELIKWLL